MTTPSPPATAASARLERLEQLLRQDPGNALLLGETADAALAAGAFERVEQLVDAGLRATGDLSAWRFRQSNLRIAQRRLGEAQQVLAALERDSGKHPAIAHNLAYIELLKGDFESCLATLRPWVEEGTKGQDEAALQVLWLRVLHRHERMDEAWQWTQQRLAAGALSPAASGVASLIALDLGNAEAALALSQKALDAAGPQMEALVARASVALRQGDGLLARQLLEAGLKLNPQEGRAWSTLGFVAMLEQEFGQARQLFETALTLVAGHIETWHGLGWACVQQQDLPAAAAAFDAALRLDPEFGESHGGRAVVHALLGEGDPARDHINKAQALDGANLAARYAQAVLSGEARNLQDLARLAQGELGKPKP